MSEKGKTSTLYITGLDESVTDKDLRDECAKFGAIKRVTIIKDKESRKSKGFGYLLFKDGDEATKALKELDGRVIADKPVKCKYSYSETPEWQTILDNRRQTNGGSMTGAPRGRGGMTLRRPGRGQYRGQGRGGPPSSRNIDYERSSSGRGGSRGRPGRGGMSSSDSRLPYRGASDYGRGDYESSSYDDYESSGRGDYTASSRGDYGYSGRGDYGSSSRGDYRPSGRGDYRSGRGDYGSSARGDYGSSAPGDYESSARGDYDSYDYESGDRDDYGSSRRGDYGGASSRGGSGRGGSVRGFGGARNPRGYEGARGSYLEEERQPADDYQDPYDETYGETVSRRPRQSAPSREYDSYERPSSYGTKEPPRSGTRPYESYDRYSESYPKAYEDRSNTMYEDRLPPTSSSSVDPGRTPIRGDYDRYGAVERNTLPPTSMSGAEVGRRLPPREVAARDTYYDQGAENIETSRYEAAGYPDRTAAPGPRNERGYESAYDNSRKRPAQGYAGYSDSYDQPPARVPRSQEVSYRY